MSKGRVIAIGDVHGCHAELRDLLDVVSPGATDLVVFLGDLVNRGPDSAACLEIARSLGARSLLGNHELRLLTHRRTGNDSILKDDDRRTIKQLTAKDWAYMEAMPLHLHLPEIDTVLVHGGFLPTSDWHTQPAAVVTRIQVIDSNGRPRKRAEAPDAPFWADQWNGPPFVVYGHTPRPEIYRRPTSIGIDTGCVMGGHLSALTLPDQQVLQVKARAKYY
ncbi:hypothetical protein ASA1KI_36830 [Opitutales bacterium ASA1]|uniref:metallophosphoesterase n=1 Tax=Congregicoccus parvus TaxID=3081749 RepID=UPI002B2CDF7D|nr:hypothetical protein ASA1KI_36830 [Opitutales bacterium ASA1]